jgi:hypothetical protein
VGDYGADGSDLESPDPAADWNGSSADQQFTGDSASAARRCHRSPLATAPRAVRLLQAQFPDIDFTFRSFACSGARIDRGVLGGYPGAEPVDPNNLVPRQINQANSYLASLSEDRRVDALVMNIGGNNLGFAPVMQRCTNLPPFFFEPCSPPDWSDGGAGNEDTRNVLLTGQGGDADPAVLGLDDLPFWYTQLDDAIDGRAPTTPGDTRRPLSHPPAKVFLTGPPNPLAGNFNGCLTGKYDYEKNLRSDERAWLAGEVVPMLVNAMSSASTTHGWNFVDMVPRIDRGLCDSGARQFNRNRDALRTQGATVFNKALFGSIDISVSHGWGHPNARVYEAMAPALRDAMGPHVIAAFTPGAPNGARPGPVVQLRPRVEMQVDDPPQPYASRPAGILPAGVTNQGATVAGVLGRGTGPVEVAVPTNLNSMTISTRRCGPVAPAPLPEGCGQTRDVPNVLVGTPGVPTNVRLSRGKAGITVSWDKGSGPNVTLRRFLVTATRDATVPRTSPITQTDILAGCSIEDSPEFGGDGPLVDGRSCGGSRTLGDDVIQRTIKMEFTVAPNLRSTLLALGSDEEWTITVRECTDRGCGGNGGGGSIGGSSLSASAQELIDALSQPAIVDLRGIQPVGIFSSQSATARRGRTLPLRLAWATWRSWRDLRELRLRLVGRQGELALLRIKMPSGRVTVSGLGTRRRRGTIGRRGTLRAGDLALLLRRARLVATGPRSRLVALELPLRLQRRFARGRVDVEVAATARGGVSQDYAVAGSFTVR